ncbi:MAG TPA: host attachment family protein [Xanthobacteraceae bacterium]|nr:host attachment family protein [Xanthobacteraceae bacterium]
MPKPKIKTGDWVVVCDGRKALVLENIGDAKFPSLKVIETREQPDPPTREQGTDHPGRVHESLGESRSSVEQTDWHDAAERAFLRGLVGYLDTAIAGGTPKHLFVVAPPRALGMLRDAYTPRVRKALQAEVDKDLVRAPIYDIERRLFA